LELGVEPDQMGLLLLCWSAGSIVTMPVGGRLIGRFGGRRVLTVCGAVALVGLVGAGAGAEARSVPLVAAALGLLGLGVGLWDVAMNVAASDVERAVGRSVMPRFHAGYSFGTVLAAVLGAGLAMAGVPVVAHFTVVAVFCLLGLVWGARTLLPGGAMDSDQVAVRRTAAAAAAAAATADGLGQSGLAKDAPAAEVAWQAEAVEAPPAERPAWRPGAESAASGGRTAAGESAGRPPREPARSAWGEPRVLLVGVMVLALTLAEGAANDWMASGVVQSFGTGEAAGIAALAVFLTTQTATRVFGTRLVDRFGRPAAIRASAAVALVGVALYSLGPNLAWVFGGAALWGAGAALVFPLGMSAAGDDPARAARRTSVVATIGYGAFLTGPPLLGFVASQIGFRHAMLVLAVPVALAIALASATRRH
jgi:MFS family permease